MTETLPSNCLRVLALRVLAVIMQAHPRALTIRQIHKALGWTVNSYTHTILQRLKAAGLVDFEPKKSRTIHATCFYLSNQFDKELL